MRGAMDSFKWEPDREAMLGNDDDDDDDAELLKSPIHPIRLRAFFVAVLLTVFTSSLLLVCGYLLWKELKSPQSAAVTTKWSGILLHPVPSIIYLVHNNVQFLTLTYVDTSTHQIMGNLKLVTAGILFRRDTSFLIFLV